MCGAVGHNGGTFAEHFLRPGKGRPGQAVDGSAARIVAFQKAFLDQGLEQAGRVHRVQPRHLDHPGMGHGLLEAAAASVRRSLR